jgi:transcriptional regulator with XRE-family HTH domain
VPELLQYLCDYRGLTQAELAHHCGVRREQVSRWMNGTAEPNLDRLRSALAPLGLVPIIALEPTPTVLDAMLTRSTDLDELLDWNVLDLLGTVTAAAAEDLDVVVAGEVAAVLQGVPLTTRHLALHVRAEHRARLFRLAAARWQAVGHRIGPELDPPMAIRSGPVSAILCDGSDRPASRLVRPEHPRLSGAEFAVVTLEALLAEDSTGDACLGPVARELTGRFTACGGRAE